MSSLIYPEVCWINILPYCNLSSLGQIAQTCQELKEISEIDTIWKSIIIKKYSANIFSQQARRENDTYKMYYKELRHFEKLAYRMLEDYIINEKISSFGKIPNNWKLLTKTLSIYPSLCVSDEFLLELAVKNPNLKSLLFRTQSNKKFSNFKCEIETIKKLFQLCPRIKEIELGDSLLIGPEQAIALFKLAKNLRKITLNSSQLVTDQILQTIIRYPKLKSLVLNGKNTCLTSRELSIIKESGVYLRVLQLHSVTSIENLAEQLPSNLELTELSLDISGIDKTCIYNTIKKYPNLKKLSFQLHENKISKLIIKILKELKKIEKLSVETSKKLKKLDVLFLKGKIKKESRNNLRIVRINSNILYEKIYRA